MSYEITFTRGFKEGLEGLPRDIYPIVNRQVSAIAEDPFARDTNRTRMKNAPRTFRARIGIHVRMLYRVLDEMHRVVFLAIAPRECIYDRDTGRTKPITDADRDAILGELQGTTPPHATSHRQQPPTQPPLVEPLVVIEALDWISEDELFLLQIPQETWPAILDAGSIEALQHAALDSQWKARIEDYWTNPKQTQVEKLYSLSPEQGVDAIVQRPLSELLIMLDPEQRLALGRIKDQGPYLLKGSAGTGKTLVGLYHIRDLVVMRTGVSLFDTAAAQFGVITFTNTLVEANDNLLRAITPTSSHEGIHCTTLDKIAYDLAKEALGTQPNALDQGGIAKFLREDVEPQFDQDSTERILLQRLGHKFVADEIEQTIFDNGLKQLDDYLKVARSGRQRGLRREERQGIWYLFERLKGVFSKKGVQTFAQLRLIALDYLREHPKYPRYAALFVDEAQDFSKVARQLCIELVADPKNLLLAADTGQSIYTTPPSWRQCDPHFNFQGRRPIELSKSYRMTWQIGQAIAGMRSDTGDEDEHSNNATPVFSGPKPVWIYVPRHEHPNKVAELVYGLIHDVNSPIPPGWIAIIVRINDRAGAYSRLLKANGISCLAVTREAPIKLDQPHVHIITAHSSKGLGFPVVVVPDVSEDFYPLRQALSRAKDQEQREDILSFEQRLLYVALSRASHQLFMVADCESPSPFLNKLDEKTHWITR